MAALRQNEWPIYSLADYENSGSLLRLTRSILSTTAINNDNENISNCSSGAQTQPTTSGYLTEDRSPSRLLENGIDRKSIKLKVVDSEQKSGLLQWWQLIETRKDKQDPLVDSYRVQVLQLCSSLHKAVSVYLTPSTATGLATQQPATLNSNAATTNINRPTGSGRLVSSHSLQQPVEQVAGGGVTKFDRLARSRGSSVAEECLSPTTIRRLSWRRQALARCPADGRSRRRLESVEQTDQRHINNRTEHQNGGKNILETWINFPFGEDCDDCHRLPLNLLRPHWSKDSLKRGKYGESLVHILTVGQTNEHLILLVLLFHLYPDLLADVFESIKFKGLGCLHLTIAYANEPLLRHLLRLARGAGNRKPKRARALATIFEQRVTGSLFRCPISSKQSKAGVLATEWLVGLPCLLKKLLVRNRLLHCSKVSGIDSSGLQSLGESSYWCDQMDHWPTADGHAHLILFNRALARGQTSQSTEWMDEGAEKGCEPLAGAQTPIYLGDTPLSWTVSFRSRSMYELLVAAETGTHGAHANQDAQDADGNTCLHQLVINNQTGWTRFLVKSGASASLENAHGLTPFLLACHLGRFRLFNEFLELSAVEFWSYSMIRCCGYPLTSLDSILAESSKASGSDHDHKPRSAMSVIMESQDSDNEQKSRLLSSAVVKKLLQEKWRLFARRLFYRELFLSLSHLMLMTLAISLRPSQWTISTWSMAATNESNLQVKRAFAFLWLDHRRLIRHLSELATVFISTVQLMRFANEWRQYANVTLQRTYNPLLPNFVASNGLIVVCAFVRLVASIGLMRTGSYSSELAHVEDVLLIFAAPLLWSSLLFFIAAFRVTGPFVAMIRYMIVRDLRQFSVIYLIFLYAFAQCIFFVNYKPASVDVKKVLTNETYETNNTVLAGFLARLLSSHVDLWMDLFKMTLGVYDLQPYRHSSLARLFFLLFIYLIPILFNMLIAMMNNTYSMVISQSERAWSFQWARTLFALERRLSQKERSAYLRLYSINVVAPPVVNQRDENKQIGAESKSDEQDGGGSRFVPALMIIKRMTYTRAERRRIILGYWQVIRRLDRILPHGSPS